MKNNFLNNRNNKILSFITNHLDLVIFSILLFYKLFIFNKQVAGHSSTFIFATLGLIFILMSFTIYFSLKGRIIFLYTLDLLATFIIMSDLLFFRYYNDVISVPILMQIKLAGALKNSILALYQVKDIYLLLDLILLFPIIAFICFKMKNNIFNTIKKRAIKSIIILIIGISLINFTIFDIQNKMGKRIFINVLDQTFFVNQLNIINFHVFDIGKYINKKLNQSTITESEYNEIEAWFKTNRKNNKNELTGIAKDENVIIIQVEALQNFVINKKINGKDITPNLNKLIGETIYYDNFYYQTANGNTSDAEFLTNTSFYPASKGSAYFQYATNKYASLPKILKQNGYKTMVMHAFKPSYWNRTTMYQAIEFDKFYSNIEFSEGEKVGWGIGDEDFLQQTADILEKSEKPFYSFVITLSSHYPYEAFKNDTTLDVGEYAGTFLGKYFKAVHYTDAAIGNFIERLKQDELWDNSILIMYGDHNGITNVEKQDLLDYEKTPFSKLNWAKLQKVPYWIHVPNTNLAKTENTVAGQINTMPTILNLLGIDIPNIMGKDLLDKNYDPLIVFRSGTFTDGKIFYFNDTNTVFDLKTSKELPLDNYEQKIKNALKELTVSDKILENNVNINSQ